MKNYLTLSVISAVVLFASSNILLADCRCKVGSGAIERYKVPPLSEDAADKACKNTSGGKGVLECDYQAK